MQWQMAAQSFGLLVKRLARVKATLQEFLDSVVEGVLGALIVSSALKVVIPLASRDFSLHTFLWRTSCPDVAASAQILAHTLSFRIVEISPVRCLADRAALNVSRQPTNPCLVN